MSTESPNSEQNRKVQAKRPVEVHVDQLHKSFGDNHVLRGIDLQVSRGELIAIVGGSGCGKSVLLAHLYAHLKPDSGHVWIADHETPGAPLVDITALSEDDLDRVRIHWAVVLQHNALFSATVFENIRPLASRDQADER
jgi:phospholipid/cholesterol/gamma-HCH transport system ATP-binding protein